jgi:quinol monooxygenase YgiN
VVGYGRCGKIVATAGNGDTLAAHLLDAASALERVEECHLYLVSRDPVEPEAVWVVEFWQSAEAHRASLELNAVQELISRARPIIAAMGERIELHPVGGKGLDPEAA